MKNIFLPMRVLIFAFIIFVSPLCLHAEENNIEDDNNMALSSSALELEYWNSKNEYDLINKTINELDNYINTIKGKLKNILISYDKPNIDLPLSDMILSLKEIKKLSLIMKIF